MKATRTTPAGDLEHRCAACWEWLQAHLFGSLKPRPKSSSRRSYCRPCRARAAREARAISESVYL